MAGLLAGAASAALAPMPDEASSVAYATGSAAIALATWLRGPSAGILTVLLTSAGALYLHLEPIGAFAAAGGGDVAGLLLYGLSGLVVVLVAGRSRTHRAERPAGPSEPGVIDPPRPGPVVDQPAIAARPGVTMAAATRVRLVEPLTDREIEVLEALATGRSNEEIAASLFISLNTVKSHLKTIYGKLGVRSRTQAAGRGLALGVIGLGAIHELDDVSQGERAA